MMTIITWKQKHLLSAGKELALFIGLDFILLALGSF